MSSGLRIFGDNDIDSPFLGFLEGASFSEVCMDADDAGSPFLTLFRGLLRFGVVTDIILVADCRETILGN